MHFFVTGIGTDVGKTIVSAILTEALEADYWKPIQSGITPSTDRGTVERYISNGKSTVFQNAITLQAPMSPHASAALENTSISLSQITRPITANSLVI
ncbi:AAA family ATPase, partial [Arthrospira platensis SPKY1]|nr:AAA family ATPase [Arthrospira platensis SPKY1]